MLSGSTRAYPVKPDARNVLAVLARSRGVLPALVVVVVSLLWVHFMPRAVLMGDDLSLVAWAQHWRWPDTFISTMTASREKFRPVLEILLFAILPAFGANMYAYVALNTVVEIASALTVVAIAMRLTRGNALLVTAAGCAFVVCRFSYYHVIQLLGIMEGLALLLTLLAVRAVVIAYQDERPRALWNTVWLGALAVLTDERFLAIVPFLVAAPLLHPVRRARVRLAITLALANCVTLLTYAAIKLFVFRTAFANGAAGQPLQPHAGGILTFLRSAVENMLGVNAGDPYMSGMDPAYLGARAYLIGALVGAPMLAMLVWYTVDVVRRRAPSIPYVLGVVLFVPLLLTTTVTIRQEFRWLYAPFAVLVLGLVGAAGRYGARSIPAALVGFALIASACGAVYYRQFAPNIYFVHDMAVAGAVRDELLRDPSARVLLIDHNDRSFQGWAFQDEAFFRVNGLDPTRVQFVSELADAAGISDDKTVLSAEMTEAGAKRVEAPPVAVVPFPNARYSFESKFAKGAVSPARPVPATPGGRGAFLFPFPGEARGMSSLTVLPGFRFTFRQVSIAKNDHLAFYVGQPMPAGAPSRAFVSVQDAHGRVEVFSEIVKPSLSDPVWRQRDIALSSFAGRRVDIAFGAEPTTDDRTAWVAFADPSLVVAAP